MASLTVVLHYRRTASYGLNVLLGAVEQELGLRPGGDPGPDGIAVVPASGIDAVGQAVSEARRFGRRVLVAWSFYSPEALTVAGELQRMRSSTGADAEVVHVAGGVHASAEPAATLAMGFDLVAVGEGEQTFVDLVTALAAGATVEDVVDTVAGLVAGAPGATGPGTAELGSGGPGGTSLRRSGPAARHPLGRFPAFAPVHGRYNPIEITRGCVYGCTFCQTPYQFKARFRHRPVDDVARHAAAMVRSGRRDVRFLTPTALSYGSPGADVDLDAIEALLATVRGRVGPDARVFFGTFPSEVRPEHVTPAALRLIRRFCDNDNLVIGGQSGSEAVLARTNRGHGVEVIVEAVRHSVEAGLQPNVDLLFGLPEETPADAEASLTLSRRLVAMGARVHGHTFMPLPGTPLRDAPAGTLDDDVRAHLDRLASDGALYGSWRRQEQVAAQLVSLRPTRRRPQEPR